MDILVFVLPTILIVCILWLCKTYNFSILPQELQGKTPLKFKFPKLSREKIGNVYKWEVDNK